MQKKKKRESKKIFLTNTGVKQTGEAPHHHHHLTHTHTHRNPHLSASPLTLKKIKHLPSHSQLQKLGTFQSYFLQFFSRWSGLGFPNHRRIQFTAFYLFAPLVWEPGLPLTGDAGGTAAPSWSAAVHVLAGLDPADEAAALTRVPGLPGLFD